MTGIKQYLSKTLPNNILNILEKDIYLDDEKTFYHILSNGIVLTTNYNKTGQIKEIRDEINHSGYHIVHLHHKGKTYTRQIHRLVAEAFVPNDDQENKIQVNHVDGDKDNNTYTNLEWVTPSDNINHAVKNDLIKTCDKCSHAKYTNAQIIHVCELFVENELTCSEISKITGVHIDMVRDILRKKSWKKICTLYDFSKYNKKDMPGARGSKNSRSTLTEDTVIRICEDIESNKISLVDISKKYNTTYKIVQHIYNGSSWKFISCDYDFSQYDRYSHLKNRCSTTIESIV